MKASLWQASMASEKFVEYLSSRKIRNLLWLDPFYVLKWTAPLFGIAPEGIYLATSIRYRLVELERRYATQVVNDLEEKRQVKFISTSMDDGLAGSHDFQVQIVCGETFFIQ
jgi:hypothetical protein